MMDTLNLFKLQGSPSNEGARDLHINQTTNTQLYFERKPDEYDISQLNLYKSGAVKLSCHTIFWNPNPTSPN